MMIILILVQRLTFFFFFFFGQGLSPSEGCSYMQMGVVMRTRCSASWRTRTSSNRRGRICLSGKLSYRCSGEDRYGSLWIMPRRNHPIYLSNGWLARDLHLPWAHSDPQNSDQPPAGVGRREDTISVIQGCALYLKRFSVSLSLWQRKRASEKLR